MANKSYTILLTSNSSTEVKTLTISKAWVRAGLCAVVVLLLLLVVFLFDYASVLSRVRRQDILQSENTLMKQNYQLLEGKLTSLENSLHRVREYSDKIKAVAPWGEKKTAPPVPMSPAAEKINNSRASSFQLASASPLRSLAAQLSFLKKAPLDKSKTKKNSTEKQIIAMSLRLEKIDKKATLQEQNVAVLWQRLSQKKFILDSTPNTKPVKGGWYTSKFGYRTDPFTGASVMHSGLDIAAAPGTPVYAPAAGIVAYVSYEEGYGNLVTIDHGFGIKTRYAHNSEVHVTRGQSVSRGDLISSVGSTGRSSGSHLHYEVRLNGVAVDPMNYIGKIY